MRKLFLILILLGCATWTKAAPMIVQQATCQLTAGFAHACTATFGGGNVTAGNSVIALIGSSGSGVSGVTGGGVTFTAGPIQQSPGTPRAEIWYGHVSAGGSAAIQVTVVGTRMGVIALEVSGLTNAAPGATNVNSATDASPLSNAVTPTSANSLVVAITNFAGSVYSAGPTNSFFRTSVPTPGSINGTEGAYQIESSAASYSTGWTLSSSVDWGAVIAAFGAPASGPTNAQRSAGFFM